MQCFLVLLIIVATGLVGCTPAPGSLPLAHAHLGREHGLVLGGMATASFNTRQRGEPFREPPRCARAFDGYTGYQPATDPACVLDGQGSLIGRKGLWSLGGMVFGGQNTGVAVGGIGGLHLIETSHHALTLGAGLGLAFLEADLSYGVLPLDGLWLFVSPGIGAGGQQIAQRVNAGVRIDLTRRLGLIAQGGVAHRAADDDLLEDHSYLAWHAGLGLSFFATEPAGSAASPVDAKR
jgi:hypothetical protein